MPSDRHVRFSTAVVGIALAVALALAAGPASAGACKKITGKNKPCIKSSDIKDGQVGSADIRSEAVTASKLSDVFNRQVFSDRVEFRKLCHYRLRHAEARYHRQELVAFGVREFTVGGRQDHHAFAESHAHLRRYFFLCEARVSSAAMEVI